MENVTTVDEFLLLSQTGDSRAVACLLCDILNNLPHKFGWKWSYINDCDFGTQTPLPYIFLLGETFLSGYCYSLVTLPKVLMNLLSTHRAISFQDCITQLHFFHFLGSTEAILLAVMTFDRFIAICNPLHYTVIMSPQLCVLLAAVAWFMSFLMHSTLTARLNFCHSLKLNHFFCDVKPLLELACSNTELNQWLLPAVTGSISTGAFFLTLLSYLIDFLLLKNRSYRILCKSLSTCASHFVVVCLFYGPVGFTYIRPTSAISMSEDWTVAVFYSAVTPVLNPLIYTLRNKDVMLVLKKIFGGTSLTTASSTKGTNEKYI